MTFSAPSKRLLIPFLCLGCIVATAPVVRLEEGELGRGIALVNEGDFAAAVVTLDAALRALEAQPGNEKRRAQAQLYLGVAYLELDQEGIARTRFREALRLDPGMRLDPDQFSPQVLRTFEATHLEVAAELAAGTGAPPAPAAAKPGSPRPPGQGTAERRKKNKVWPFLLIGGGAAVTGVALASGGGGGASTLATTTTTTSPPTTNPSTTTTAPPAPSPSPPPQTCSYDATSQPEALPAGGGNASCQVRTGSNCQWTAELDKGGDFVTLTGGTNGPGNGSVTFQFTANTTNDKRDARIRLRNTTTPTEARCEFEQQSVSGLVPGWLVWTGMLDVEGGSGQVVVDGAVAAFQERTARHSLVAGSGAHRIEATLVRAGGRPGTWRFDLTGNFEAGSLRPIAGDVLFVTGEAIAFRLAGRPGERVAFAFKTAR